MPALCETGTSIAIYAACHDSTGARSVTPGVASAAVAACATREANDAAGVAPSRGARHVEREARNHFLSLQAGRLTRPVEA